MDVVILRDPREPWKKCSLNTLRRRSEVRFVVYRPDLRLDVGGRVLLHPDGDELTDADRGSGLFLVDCSWRRLSTLLRTADGPLRRRRVPHYQTAYPRKSKAMSDPPTGLASIEALYAATVLLGEPRPEWLTGYHFAEEFFRANPSLRPELAS